MGSGANALNPFITSRIRALHFDFENYDRPLVFGRKSTDTVLSLRKQRENIIKDYFQKISFNYNLDELDYLISSTRGLIIGDIHTQLNCFVNNGVIDYRPDDPSNTCDSLTGNWFERLMNPFKLKRKFSLVFQNISVECGYYYSIFNNKYFIPKFLINCFIALFPKYLSIKLSPFYIIYGKN